MYGTISEDKCVKRCIPVFFLFSRPSPMDGRTGYGKRDPIFFSTHCISMIQNTMKYVHTSFEWNFKPKKKETNLNHRLINSHTHTTSQYVCQVSHSVSQSINPQPQPPLSLKEFNDQMNEDTK